MSRHDAPQPVDPLSLSAVEAIARRRTTRRFDPARPVPDEVLRRLLGLATLAPSTDNLQPWRFLVVRSARNRERLRACAHGQRVIAEAPVVVIVLGYLNPHRTELEPMVAEQVRRGLIDPDEAAGLRGRTLAAWERTADRAGWAIRSASLAAATLMLAAEAVGVASAWIGGFEPEPVREAFGVPDDHALCGLIALGYAAEPAPFPGRFGLEHVGFEEHFGQPWTLGEPTNHPLDLAPPTD